MATKSLWNFVNLNETSQREIWLIEELNINITLKNGKSILEGNEA